MKKFLIFASSAAFIFGAASGREVDARSAATSRARIAAERVTAKANSADRETGVFCTTRYFPMTKDDGSMTTRKSVDCDE